jgi:hypothetical protein
MFIEKHNIGILIGFVACLVFLNTGCGLLNSKEQVVEKMVTAGNQQRASIVTPDGKFSDYRVYREGEMDEVVFEYKLKPDMQLTEVETLKNEISKEFLGDESGPNQVILKAGVVVSFVYLNSGGKQELKHTISNEGL